MRYEGAAGLQRARVDASLGMDDLWIRYFALGGAASNTELEEYLEGGPAIDSLQHDVIAQALNEAFTEQGKDSSVAYVRP